MELLIVFIVIVGSITVLFFAIRSLIRKSRKSIELRPVPIGQSFKPEAIVIDTETTGLVKDNSIRATKKNVLEIPDNFPRIVQLGFMLIDKDGFYKEESYFIKQTDPIPKQAIKIHGISDEKCEAEGIELVEALSSLTVAVSEVDSIVGHNVAFDYKVLHAEYIRAEVPFSLTKKNKIDTMKMVAKRLGKKHGFKISLYNSADEIFGNAKSWKELKSQINSHSADGDVFVTASLYAYLR